MADIKTNEAPNALYRVHCVECGEMIEEKFFSLDPLLEQYNPFNMDELKHRKLQELLNVLKIGAAYGQDILPEMPGLVNGKDFIVPEAKPKLTGIPRFQTDENNNPPSGELRPVKLTIAAIVAEFVRMTGFKEIYRMLELQWRYAVRKEDNDALNAELTQHIGKFTMLFRKNLQGYTNEERNREARELIATILECAEYEYELQRDCYSSEELQIGWRYKVENGRQMPFSLMVVGSAGLRTECRSCCCNHCHKPISYKLGAYEQRIVGVLGTAATGKTTYIAALTDMIDMGGVTTATGTEEIDITPDITIKAQSDPQWKRIVANPDTDTSAEPGLLWRYQHGYPPQKTGWNESTALSFLVKSPLIKEEIMYTLADIAGEAFYNVVSEKQDTAAVEAQQKLLYNCDALLMVISSRQLQDAQRKGKSGDGGVISKEEEMVTSPSEVLTCCDAFLPKHPIPTAVVLTATDEIHGGDLRQLLHLAYDIRHCPPLIWSGKNQTLVYNAALMKNTSDALKNYLNTQFGRFMDTLTQVLCRGKDASQVRISAFAVSNGTQCALKDYRPDESDPYNSREQMRERYREIRSERFGVASAFLWLLACGGILAPGQGDLTYGAFSNTDQKRAADKLEKSL